MGCAQSKIDNEESVSRCKDRRNLMKEAVVTRNAFAAAHSAYSISLKNTGAALSDYGHGEAEATTLLQDDQHHPPLDATPPPPPPLPSSMDNLPPPPPPLPEFSPSPVRRSSSLPANALKNRKYALDMDNVTITEDDEEEEEDEDDEEEDDIEEPEARGGGNTIKNVENHNNNSKKGGEMAAATMTPSPRTPEARPMQNMAWDYFFNVDDQHHHHMSGTSLVTEVEEEPNTNTVDPIRHRQTVNNGNIRNDNANNNNDNVKNIDIVKHTGNVTVNKPKKVVGEEQVIIEHAKTAPPEYSRRSATTTTSTTVNLMQVLNQIDDHFLKASQTAQQVSNLLEATRMHYHSNFADNQGKILLI